MSLVFYVKVSKKGALYLPRKVMRRLGIEEGSKVKLVVQGGEIVLKPVRDPFELALTAPKFAKISVEEFERNSEEMQRELFED